MQQIERFLQQMRAQNKSAHTLENYQRDLMSFVGFYLPQNDKQPWSYDALMRHPQTVDWAAVTIQNVKQYVMQQVSQGLAASSMARHLSALRSFFQFLLREGLVKTNPAKSVKAPKQPKPLPKSVDIDQTRQLLEQPIEGGVALRDQAMFELLYSAGLRVVELVSLNVSPGLDGLANGTIKVLGKGNKERIALVGKQAQQAMQAWLKVRAVWVQADEQAVFVNRQGTRLTTRSVQLRLDKRAEQAGMMSKMSPHRLRHACATHVLESSGDLRAVQELLGHANLSTTQIYTKLDLQHLAQVYDQAHPRARKNNR
jgi:integrase/recombinase XerC